MQRYHVYGIGAALVDTEIEVNDEFLANANIEKGLMTLVDETRQQELLAHMKAHQVSSKRSSGGSACNTIIAASYFGAKTYYSYKVANDENGQFFRDDTEAAGVSNTMTHQAEGTTGKCLVMITPDAERTMNTYLGVSETLSVENIDEEALAQADFAYIEGYLVTSDSGRAAAIKVRELAQEKGVKTVLTLSDPGMVQFFRDGLQEMLGEQVDLLFCNKDEALGWTETNTVAEAAEALKKSARTFAITLGKDGALVYDGNTLEAVAGTNAKAIDTNGAGDMFAGAFLYALSEGRSYVDAAKLANHAAAQVVSQFGPRLRPEQHAEVKTQAGF